MVHLMVSVLAIPFVVVDGKRERGKTDSSKRNGQAIMQFCMIKTYRSNRRRSRLPTGFGGSGGYCGNAFSCGGRRLRDTRVEREQERNLVQRDSK